MSLETGNGPARKRRNAGFALVLGGLVCGMIGLSFAAVPLYRIFCQVTGYGGTTRAAVAVPDVISDRTIKVRFNADISPDLPWRFRPEQHVVELHLGEQGLAFYRAKNLGSRAITGTATFNVTPPAAGQYFNKIDCFCFTEQRLEAGEEVDMGVTFFVDPAIAEDPDLAKLPDITLSYTFFPNPGESSAADSGEKNTSGYLVPERHREQPRINVSAPARQAPASKRG
jgi:cytochrome c oxidase assembly protein subunit 11